MWLSYGFYVVCIWCGVLLLCGWGLGLVMMDSVFEELFDVVWLCVVFFEVCIVFGSNSCEV